MSDSNLKHLVFTYGTLKRGEPNSGVMKPHHHKFVGSGHTVRPHPLVVATKHNIPCMLDHIGLGQRVCGEVYLVSDGMLEELDEFEESPEVYQRIETDVFMTDVSLDQSDVSQATVVKCWTYKIKNFKPELLTRTFINNYLSAEQKTYTELNDKFETDDYWGDVLDRG